MTAQIPIDIYDKHIDFNVLYEVLCKAGDTNEEKLLIRKFMDKLTDSKEFSSIASEELKKCVKSTKSRTQIISLINKRSAIDLVPGYMKIVPEGKDNWTVMLGGRTLVDSLNKRIAIKVCEDINVAFNIYNSRLSNQG